MRSWKELSSTVLIILLCSINSSRFFSPERSFTLRFDKLLYLKHKIANVRIVFNGIFPESSTSVDCLLGFTPGWLFQQLAECLVVLHSGIWMCSAPLMQRSMRMIWGSRCFCVLYWPKHTVSPSISTTLSGHTFWRRTSDSSLFLIIIH